MTRIAVLADIHGNLLALNAVVADIETARYAVLDVTANACRVTFHAVPYDHSAAAAQAERGGRPDWAASLRTGYAFPNS
ncbi:MAG TPA: hypothetical protein VK636_13050 [Gemmatimonadaceae bacterium]|nr:hypothetical protein [Gemmatimonadaceae bacterium]